MLLELVSTVSFFSLSLSCDINRSACSMLSLRSLNREIKISARFDEIPAMRPTVLLETKHDSPKIILSRAPIRIAASVAWKSLWYGLKNRCF